MSATIHYLRPFERENLAEPEPSADQQSPEEDGEEQPQRKCAPRRAMPCGRNSRFKKRMDGSVVPRDKRS